MCGVVFVCVVCGGCPVLGHREIIFRAAAFTVIIQTIIICIVCTGFSCLFLLKIA
jgi:hypothetical protein